MVTILGIGTTLSEPANFRLRFVFDTANESALNVAVASVTAPAGIPNDDVRSLTHDICPNPPPMKIITLKRRAGEGGSGGRDNLA